MKKKLLAFLVFAMMLISLFPTTAFATNPGEELPYIVGCEKCGGFKSVYLIGYTDPYFNNERNCYFHHLKCRCTEGHEIDITEECFEPDYGEFTVAYRQISDSSGKDPAAYHQRTCACGQTDYQKHNYSAWTDSTRKCADCGYIQTCDHSDNVNPDCVDTTCSVCGTKISGVGHSPSANYSYDKEGHWLVCSKCTEQINATAAHEWNEGVVIRKPSCMWDGSIEYTCTVCGKTKTEKTVDLDAHSFVDAHDGDEHYQECSICSLKKNEEAHTWDEGVVLKQASCLESGLIEYTCTVCGEKCDKDLEGEHSYADAHDADNHYLECTVCHDKKDAQAHSFEWIIDREATTSEAGEKHEKCNVCGYEKEPVTVEKLADPTEPATGDEAAPALWLAVLISGGAVAVTLLYTGRKRSQNR